MKKRFFTFGVLLILIINLCAYSFSCSKSTYTKFYKADAKSSLTATSNIISSTNSVNTVANSTGENETNNDVTVYAESASLLDINTGKFLYQKNSDARMYPASTTKLLTAIVVLESNLDLSSKAKVSYYAVHSVPYTYSIANLYPDEEFTLSDLLYSLLVASANDSAYVLAEYVANGGNTYETDSSASSKEAFNKSIQTFANMMNKKAKEIGCTNSNFVNPNGIQNENHYSTANDLALIGKYAYNIPLIMKIAGTTEYSLPHTDQFNQDRNYKTTNLLLRQDRKFYYPYANGLKTGYTDAAKYCMIASAKKDERNLIAVVLHSENSTDNETSRERDCIRLFEYGFTNYTLTTLMESNGLCRTLKILNGTKDTNSLNVYCKDKLSALVKTGEVLDVTPEVKISKFLAPIARGEVIGTVSYNIDGITYSSDLIAEHDVLPSNYSNTIWILVIAFVIVFLLLVALSHNKTNRSKKSKRSHSSKTNSRKHYSAKRSTSAKSKSTVGNRFEDYYNSNSRTSAKHAKRRHNNSFRENRRGSFNHNKYLG